MISDRYFENIPNLYTIMGNGKKNNNIIIPIENKVKFDTNVKLMPIFSSYEEAKEYYDKICKTLPNLMDPKSIRIQKITFINDKDSVFPIFEDVSKEENTGIVIEEVKKVVVEEISVEASNKKSSIVSSIDKNGREIYYQISEDGKKKRISKGIALEILEKEKNN